MLREAGVPARYATGFAPVEYRNLDNSWPVRLRHAHAWAMVWVDGAWRDLDTTPSLWAAAEAEGASVLQPVSDLFDLLLGVAQGWFSQLSGRIDLFIYWLVPVFLLGVIIVIRRLTGKFHKRTVRTNPTHKVRPQTKYTLFNRLIERLEQQYPARSEGETLINWISRVCPDDLEKLRPLIVMHYQQRFGDREISKKDLEHFQNEVGKWLS